MWSFPPGFRCPGVHGVGSGSRGRATLGLATPGPAPTGAANLTQFNRGNDDYNLLGAASPVPAHVELQGSQAASGHAGHVMEMRPVAEVEVKGGQSVAFKPDGLHVMLIGLKAPLKEGERFPLTLRFAKAGEIQIEVPVARAGAMAPPK